MRPIRSFHVVPCRQVGNIGSCNAPGILNGARAKSIRLAPATWCLGDKALLSQREQQALHHHMLKEIGHFFTRIRYTQEHSDHTHLATVLSTGIY
jgi:hypothetical protein